METQRSLVKKLAEVMAVVERVAKNGRNEHHKYDYTLEGDILEAVRGELAKRSVILVPSTTAVDVKDVVTAGQKAERLTTMTVCFTAMDGDSGEAFSFNMVGQGQDPGDKGAYKASTGAEKYAVMKLFMIPTGDDPEHEPAAKDVPAPSGVAGLKTKVAAPSHPEVDGAPKRIHNDLELRFGKGKGSRLSQVDDKSVLWYMKCAQEAVDDPEKERFKSQNMLELATIQSEARFRNL